MPAWVVSLVYITAVPGEAAFSIRQARPTDLPRLTELLFQLSQAGERAEARPRPPAQAQQDMLRLWIRDPRMSCFVLVHKGKIAGMATLYVLPGLAHGGKPFGLVEDVVVDEDARGLGLGRELMEHVEALAREKGCYKLAFTSNRRRVAAHGFYEHLGFDPSHLGFTKYFD